MYKMANSGQIRILLICLSVTAVHTNLYEASMITFLYTLYIPDADNLNRALAHCPKLYICAIFHT